MATADRPIVESIRAAGPRRGGTRIARVGQFVLPLAEHAHVGSWILVFIWLNAKPAAPGLGRASVGEHRHPSRCISGSHLSGASAIIRPGKPELLILMQAISHRVHLEVRKSSFVRAVGEALPPRCRVVQNEDSGDHNFHKVSPKTFGSWRPGHCTLACQARGIEPLGT